MNKSLLIGIIILLALILIIGLVYYFVLMPAKYSVPVDTSAVNLNSPASSLPSSQVPSAGTTAVKTVNVTIANFVFTPANISINAGDTVKWTNDDQVPHQISMLGFTSQILNTGDSYSYTFTTGGIFDYKCNIHPSMTGNVNVKP